MHILSETQSLQYSGKVLLIRDDKLNSERKGRKGLKYRISRGGRVVPVELDKVVESDEDTHQVHQDPQEIQDVVPIGALKLYIYTE